MIFSIPISAILLSIMNLQKSVLSNPVSHPTLSNTLQSRHTGPSLFIEEDKCYSYILVGARGTLEDQGAGSVGYNPLIEKVLSTLPNGGKYEIVYSSAVEYFSTVKEGAVSGMEYVEDIISECPKTNFVFLGYSKGAMVVTQMLANSSLPANKVVAAALFGNPYHTSGAPQNKCSAIRGDGIASMILVKPLVEHLPKIFDCCNEGDMICQTIGDLLTHMTYRTDGAPQAAEFIINKLKSWPESGSDGDGDAGVQSGTGGKTDSPGSGGGTSSNQVRGISGSLRPLAGKSIL